jgi:hypothetical protein
MDGVAETTPPREIALARVIAAAITGRNAGFIRPSIERTIQRALIFPKTSL